MLYDRSSITTTSRAPPPTTFALAFRAKGRAKAAASAASTRQRSASSAQFRMRRRRTLLYGTRSRNMSDGKCTTAFRSRFTRCTSTGTATAASPTKNRGARKESIVSAYRTRPSRSRAAR
jgi:hypothetical protein